MAKTGLGCDGFHPTVPLDLTEGLRINIVEVLEKVEQSGRWTQQTCTTKNVTSERPIALMPMLIGWWDALKAFEVVKWQQKYRVDWDATDGRDGGAQRTEWEILLEMERVSVCAKGEDQGALSLVLDLAEAFEWVSLSVVWAWATHFSFPRSAVWEFRATEASSVRRMCGGTAPGHPCQGPSGIVCFYVSYCARCAERGRTNAPSVEIEGFCG